MKKIKAKLEEAKQFVDLIQSNAEKAIEKSKILLANTRKTTLSFKETKQSFDNSKNSFERNNVSTNKLIKTINNYIENPTKQNLELVKDKNNIAIDRNNLFSNRVFICTRNFKNTKSNLLENKENILELIKKLKKSKVIFKKLKNTYTEIVQIYESKRRTKALNNSTLKKPRIIFNISNTTPQPNCDEIRKSIEEKEGQRKKSQDYLDKTQAEFNKLSDEIVELIESDPMNDRNKKIQEEIDRLIDVVSNTQSLINEYNAKTDEIDRNNDILTSIYNGIYKDEDPTEEESADIEYWNDANGVLFKELGDILNNPDYAAYGVGQDGLDNLMSSIGILISTKTLTKKTNIEIGIVNLTLEPLAEKRVVEYNKIDKLDDEIKALEKQLEDCA
jgi:hypothetical protein